MSSVISISRTRNNDSEGDYDYSDIDWGIHSVAASGNHDWDGLSDELALPQIGAVRRSRRSSEEHRTVGSFHYE